jgi:hypothetical protein
MRVKVRMRHLDGQGTERGRRSGEDQKEMLILARITNSKMHLLDS